MDRQVALDVRKAIGGVVAIDWRYRVGCWVEYIRVRVKIDISKSLRVVYLVGVDGEETFCAVKCECLPTAQIRQPNVGIGMWRNGIETIMVGGAHEGEGERGTQNKRKKSKIGNGDAIDESLAYWAKEIEAKDLIKRVWDQSNGDVLTGFDHIRLHLGKW
ncbi:hypothetical protein Godav_025452 [Gossypium davidsonii]|uniref:Uncharacterized protein n=1 Tax=Gossypium davidsonii TaxID=34287 RepID=A0A7J8T6K4_GOSDV|nr:hypothetical protein [Gossypium davidsonii]